MLGLAQRFANRTEPGADLPDRAIFPYYILHQTIIVVVGYWFTMVEAPAAVEATAIVAATVIGCAAGYEVMRRVTVLRPLFGLPMRRWEQRRRFAACPRTRHAEVPLGAG